MKHLLSTAIIAAALAGACQRQSAAPADDAGTGSDSDSTSDDDTGTGSDSETEQVCTPGEYYCVGDDVYFCPWPGDQGQYVETCEPPEHCEDGLCVTDDACGQAALARTSIGCAFFAVDMHSQGLQLMPYGVVAANASDEVATVSVEARDGEDWVEVAAADVSPGEAQLLVLTGTTVDLDPELQGTDGTYLRESWAYLVSSSRPIAAFQLNPIAGLGPSDEVIASADATPLLPVKGLGRRYRALAYPDTIDQSVLNIVATRDGTAVRVTPTSGVIAGESVPGLQPGVEHEFAMQAADVLQLESNGDLSGSTVEADWPIAVFGGSGCAQVPSGTSYCDHIEHVNPPLSTWGTEFVAARSPVRSLDAGPESDYWRIVAFEDETTVEAEPDVAGLPTDLLAGQAVMVSADHSFAISASHPVLVGQYLTGSTATDVPEDGPCGDPAFSVLTPVEQFIDRYLIYVPEEYLVSHVVITLPAGSEVSLDDQPVLTHPDCQTEALDDAWEIARCQVSDHGHAIAADQPIGVAVFGYGYNISYGYSAGTGLMPINPVY